MLSLGHMRNNLRRYNQVRQQLVEVDGQTPELTMSVEAFLRSLIGKNGSPATIKAYRSDLAQFVGWLVENNVTAVHPTKVSRADIQAYLTELAHQGLTGVSRARKLAAIREYFRFLELHEVIARSPAAVVCRCARSRTGWATRTSRPPRPTPTSIGRTPTRR